MVIFNNVDFDFPQCGGYIISKGTKYLTIEKQSNYSGNQSDCRVRLGIDTLTAQAIIREVANDDVDLEYLSGLSYVGGHIVQ
jgi:hypothetical protein